MRNTFFRLFILLVFLSCEPSGMLAQTTPDSLKKTLDFKGSVSVTNNGFSFIPTFSLGEPALVTTFAVHGKKRLSFEPEFRYSLEGKPWSLIFIWRYQLVRQGRFKMALGTHLPTLSFISGPVIKNGLEQEAIQARRFFPVIEVMPHYSLTKNIQAGMYYLYGLGIEKELARNTHFLTFRLGFNHIPLSERWYMRFNPQVYFLNMDAASGFYAAGGLSVARKGWPLSVSCLVNKAIETDIKGKDFDWNVSLNYTFGSTYVKR
ncbi:MAG: hypothetical protein IT269_14150 [Saprospiraceae bacterium]|nr:hypothetical protein [Saprospiraceae bacterium]